MSRPQRRLFLHTSALTNVEYAVYTAALHDILDCADSPSAPPQPDIEDVRIGVREVRAWMRGRYRDVSDIDHILRMFCPALAPADTLSGGQLLAALRLVMHVRAGTTPSEEMVFVQAIPTSPTTPTPHHGHSPTSAAAASPAPAQDAPSTNPFTHDTPPQHPSASSRRASVDSPYKPPSAQTPTPPPPPPVVPPPLQVQQKTNPFLQRSKSQSHAAPPNSLGKTPPLPPRKPPAASLVLAPPGISPPKSVSPLHPLHPHHHTTRATNNNNGNHAAIATTSANKPPPPPPPPMTSALMKQSLHASKAGLSLKKAQAQLERERVLEVIQTSSAPRSRSPHKDGGTGGHRGGPPGYSSGSGSASTSTSRSASAPAAKPTASATGRRPVPSPPASASSFEQVASASLRTTHSRDSSMRASASEAMTPGSSPTRPTPDLPPAQPTTPGPPPPTHPDRRQRSLHHRHVSIPPSSPFERDFPASPFEPAQSQSQSQSQSPGPPRPTRSKSLHVSSSPSSSPLSAHSNAGTINNDGVGAGSPILPPPRRRPESVQITRYGHEAADERDSPFANAFSAFSPFSAGVNGGGGGGRSALVRGMSTPGVAGRDEWDRERGGAYSGSSPERYADREREKERGAHVPEAGGAPQLLTTLQKTLSTLTSKAQPTLARARYKAEAGLAPRRGFVPHHHGGTAGEMLMQHDAGWGGADMDADVDVSGDDGEGVDGGGGASESRVGDVEKDVAGEGERGRGRVGANGWDTANTQVGEGWVPL